HAPKAPPEPERSLSRSGDRVLRSGAPSSARQAALDSSLSAPLHLPGVRLRSSVSGVLPRARLVHEGTPRFSARTARARPVAPRLRDEAARRGLLDRRALGVRRASSMEDPARLSRG